MARDPRTANPPWLVVATRALLVALAAGAVVVAAVVSRPGAPAVARRYVCPMHSEVTAAGPGDCPICGMALEEAGASPRVAMPHEPAVHGSESVALSALRASTEATNLLRFSVAQARRNALPGELHAPAIVEADGAITAELYRDELPSLAADELGELIPSAAPTATIKVRRTAAPPVERGAIARVRFQAEPGAAPPTPGQTGWIRLPYKTRAMLMVRSAAVLQGADGPYVLVFSAERGALTRRRVEIGKEYSGMTAVVSGLRDKEFVVMANTYAFDAERRLQDAP